MSKHPYIRKSPTLTPCTKCGNRLFKTQDERKYACVSCGKAYNEELRDNA